MLTKNYNRLIGNILANGSSLVIPYSVENHVHGPLSELINTEGVNLAESSSDMSTRTDIKYLTGCCQQPTEKETDYTFAIADINTKGDACGFMLLVGSGDTEANKNDYKLQEPITTLETFSQSIQYAANDKMLVISRTFSNTSENAVMIKEIGLYNNILQNIDEPETQRNFTYLLAREVFATPVEIAPGSIYTFTMAIK